VRAPAHNGPIRRAQRGRYVIPSNNTVSASGCRITKTSFNSRHRPAAMPLNRGATQNLTVEWRESRSIHLCHGPTLKTISGGAARSRERPTVRRAVPFPRRGGPPCRSNHRGGYHGRVWALRSHCGGWHGDRRLLLAAQRLIPDYSRRPAPLSRRRPPHRASLERVYLSARIRSGLVVKSHYNLFVRTQVFYGCDTRHLLASLFIRALTRRARAGSVVKDLSVSLKSLDDVYQENTVQFSFPN
jgi:hypothetical protein